MAAQCWFHIGRGEHGLVLAICEQLEKIGESRNDREGQLQGRFSYRVTGFLLGEFVPARTLFEWCIGLDDPTHRAADGPDGGAARELVGNNSLEWLALTLAYLGYIDQARSRMHAALSEARGLGHAHELAGLLSHASWLDWLTGSPDVHNEEFLALTNEHGFPFYVGRARAYRRRSLIAFGHAQEDGRCSNRGWGNAYFRDYHEYIDVFDVACRGSRRSRAAR
jgi:hypothetical protein